MNSNAVIISNKYPYPPDDGKKTVLAGFLDYVLDRFGRENVLYVVIGRRTEGFPDDLKCRTVWIPPPKVLTQVWNVLKCVVMVDPKSLQEALTFSPAIARKLSDVLDPVRPQLIILDTLRIGQYFWSGKPKGSRLILYMDDLFSLRFRRMTEVARSAREIKFDPAGTFSSALPAVARTVIRIRIVHKLLFAFESARAETRERACTSRFDQCLLINPNEAKALLAECPGRPIATVTPVLFRQRCSVRRRFDGTPLFLLFGSLRHPVYRASVIQFLARDMESLLISIPNAQIVLVGDGADDEIHRMCLPFGGRVRALGFVDSLDDIFSTACALLVPLLAAGGLKLKVLTALYYGLPVIATNGGVDGIPLTDGKHFLLENVTGRFAIHMRQLMDVAYNQQMSGNAAAIFEDLYSKSRIYMDYDALMGAESVADAKGAN